MNSFVIFTDGASRGNPGPGGWAAVIIEDAKSHSAQRAHRDRVSQRRVSSGSMSKKQKGPQVTELGGREDHTTNNKMELVAAIRGISAAPSGSSITLYTDSSYVINGITQWIEGWKRNGWKTKTKEDVMNKILWMELDSALEGRMVAWKYVGGHVGIAGNERCDEIATGFADGKKMKLYNGPLSKYSIKKILTISLNQTKLVKKSSDRARSAAKAYSYVSAVNGRVEIHQTWAECEKRVKGVKGARFKKALDKAEEIALVSQFTA